MPTISAQLDVSLQGGELSASLVGQTGHLGEAATLLASLIAEPPGSIEEFANALGTVGLPEIDVVAELSPAIESLRAAIPSDLSLTTEGLLSLCLSLGVKVNGELVPQVQKLISGIESLGQLIERARSFGVGEVEAEASGGTSGGGIGGGVTSPDDAPATPAEARRDERGAAVGEINAALDQLPQPFDAPALLTFARDQLSGLARETIAIPYLPVVDDLLFILSTTIELQESDAPALEMHIRSSVDRLAVFLSDVGKAPVDDLIAQLSTLPPHLGAAALKTNVETLISGIAELAAAVDARDVTTTGPRVIDMNAALDDLLPALASLEADLFSGQVEAATEAFARLPSDMDAALRRVAHATTPPGFLDLFKGAGLALQQAVDDSGMEELVDGMGKALEEVLQTLDRLDIASQLTDVEEVIAGLSTSVGDVEAMLSDVAAQVSAAFDDLKGLIAEVNLSSVTQEVEAALASFVDDLRKQVDDLFAPVEDALSSAVEGVSSALSDFDPAALVDAVEDAIDKLAFVLDDPAITGAVEEIKGTLDGVASALQTLTFKPVTDQVVGTIEEITAALNAINPDELSPATKMALSAAVMLLPADLAFAIDPLKLELSGMLELGPKPLLEQVRAQPGLLLDRVRLFSPEALIGTELSGPFEQLVAELETFTPSSLLTPVTDAIDGVKGQLQANADPAALVDPLRAPFDEIKSGLDAIDPAALVAPLQDAITAGVDAIRAAIPLDDVLGVLDDFVATAESISETALGIKSLFEKVTGIVGGLADPEDQLRAWLQPVIDRVDQISNISDVQVSLDAVAAALDDLRADALRPRVAAQADPISASLNELAPGALLAELTTAYRSLSQPALATLGSSTHKDALEDLLGRFNPLDPDFGRCFLELEQWSSALDRDRAAWEDFLDLWERRAAETHPPLQGLRHPAVTKPELKAIVEAGFEDEIIKPLAAVLGLVGDAAASLQAPLEELTHFIDQVAVTVTSIASGPASLVALKDAMNGLLDAIDAIDLQFLVDELQEVFDEVSSQLDAISPDAVATLLSTAFNGALDALDPTQLLPAEEMTALDAEYAIFVDALKELDPTKLVIEATMPVFEEKIIPLIAVFDLTPVIEALIKALETLEVELGVELERVNVAYKAMLDAVPQISLLDIDIEIDIDVGVSF